MRKPNNQKRRPKKPAKRTSASGIRWWKVLLTLFILSIVGLALACCAVVAGYIYLDNYFGERMPDLSVVKNYRSEIRRNATVYDADGEVICRLPYEERRQGTRPVFAPTRVPVLFKEIPKSMIAATLAAEDRRFYEHNGVDYIGMASALVYNIKAHAAGRKARGASTITMQVVKLLFFAPGAPYGHLVPKGDKWQRKGFEWKMAREIEKVMSKDDVLEIYHNLANYGAGAGKNNVEGIREAARVWFAKTPHELTTVQSAFLASLYKAPTNLFGNPNRPNWAMERRNYVIDGLVAMGQVGTSSAAVLKEQPLVIAERPADPDGDQTGWLCTHIKNFLRVKYGSEVATGTGLQVYTTFRLKVQRLAEAGVRQGLDDADRKIRYVPGKNLEAGFAIMSYDGAMLAMVGGRTASGAGKFNRVTQAERQIGSTFKPIVYATAMEHPELFGGFPGTCLDVQRTYNIAESQPPKTYTPKNYMDKTGGGYIWLWKWLKASSNVCTMYTVAKLGFEAHPEDTISDEAWETDGPGTIHIDPVIAMTKRLGYEAQIRPYQPSAMIGAVEVTLPNILSIYVLFSNGGHRVEPHFITKVVGGTGAVLEERSSPSMTQVLSAKVAYLVVDALRIVAEPIAKNLPVVPIGKTGTTNDSRTTWFMGATPSFGAGIWVGYDDSSVVTMANGKGATGGDIARAIWASIIAQVSALPEYEAKKEFAPPADGSIRFVEVDGVRLAAPAEYTVRTSTESDTWRISDEYLSMDHHTTATTTTSSAAEAAEEAPTGH